MRSRLDQRVEYRLMILVSAETDLLLIDKMRVDGGSWPEGASHS